MVSAMDSLNETSESEMRENTIWKAAQREKWLQALITLNVESLYLK